MDYLSQLNEPQRKAVEATEGPAMVIAGAGSGKTRVLTYRIAHLINKGVDPFRILALTFTNKAAREMKTRIAEIVGTTEARNIWMGTFHSIFARILRVEGHRIGYPSNFSIYDTTDSRSLVKSIVKELKLDDKVYKPSSVHGRISAAKNNLISPEAYAQNTDIINEDHAARKPELAKIYQMYNQRLFRAGAMDFDDLLFNTNILLRDHPEVLHKYQHRFNYVLVDEYQDTNFSQYLIVKKLAAAHENLCVVGDDAQSIYAFRGANIQNILNFRKDYPDYKLFKMEQNYRSTQHIVNAANSVIQKNKEQIEKKVWTRNDEGNPIKVNRLISDNEEGIFVANDIFHTRANEKCHNSDFAILYRTNAQSRSLEEALRKINIPYRIYGGLSFYQRKEIKDLIGYFRLTANHNDEEALKRVINYPKRGIGQTTMDKVTVAAGQARVPLWNVVKEPGKFNLQVNGAAKTKLENFATMIESFAVELDSAGAYELGHKIASSSGILRELYSDKTPEGVSRYENIQELLNGMKEFSEIESEEEPEKVNTLSDFLVDVALLTDADQDDGDEDKVSLMTIHAAKGLEFPYVYIVGMEENLFPSQMSVSTRAELEEERRLFYVALTRAMKRATLSYATSRYKWGNLEMCEPSRFLDELDPQYVEMPPAPDNVSKSWIDDDDFGEGWGDFGRSRGGAQARPSRKPTENTGTQPPPGRNFKKVSNSQPGGAAPTDGSEGEIVEGAEVKHAKFGKGKVLQVEGNAPNTKATVLFPKAGKKQLLLKYAKLQVL